MANQEGDSNPRRKTIRLGLIGTGNIAEKHLEVLKSFADVEVTALCNSGHPRIHDCADRFGIAARFTDYKQFLDQADIEAVLVLVSVVRVAEVTAECLQRGIPTLIEKPPGLSPAETASLAALATKTNTINMVALNRRFYSVMQRAREAILEAGPLVSMVVEAPERIADYRAAGHPAEVINNILFANGIHCLDLFRYFGGEVAKVKNVSTQWFENQNDSYNALLRFENGATGHYISNWTTPGRWSVNLYGKDRKITLCPLERGTVLNRDGEPYDLPVDSVDQDYKPGIYAQARYFIDCVREQRKPAFPAADLDDAVKTMKLVELISGVSK
jgi:predicted dehydrogenase